MRYVMKQKFFCLGDDFCIKDEQGRDVFFVDGKAFSLGEQLSFQDMVGNELAFIRQKILSWGPTYEIYRGSQLAAVVKNSLFTFLHCKFTVDVPGPDDLEAEGRLPRPRIPFHPWWRTVATVSKQWFTLTDTYGVEIADGEDDMLILASTVVIDMACHGDQRGGGIELAGGGSGVNGEAVRARPSVAIPTSSISHCAAEPSSTAQNYVLLITQRLARRRGTECNARPRRKDDVFRSCRDDCDFPADSAYATGTLHSDGIDSRAFVPGSCPCRRCR